MKRLASLLRVLALAKKCARSKSDLSGADLSDADLYGADLRSANLSGADLGDADLCDADLCGANQRSANIRDAILLTQGQLDGACGDEYTKLAPPLTSQATCAGQASRGRLEMKRRASVSLGYRHGHAFSEPARQLGKMHATAIIDRGCGVPHARTV